MRARPTGVSRLWRLVFRDDVDESTSQLCDERCSGHHLQGKVLLGIREARVGKQMTIQAS